MVADPPPDDWNPSESSGQRDLYPHYARLRELAPVVKIADDQPGRRR